MLADEGLGLLNAAFGTVCECVLLLLNAVRQERNAYTTIYLKLVYAMRLCQYQLFEHP